MNINILLSIENEIVRTGLSTIILNGIFTSKIFFVNNSEITKEIKTQNVDIIIIEFKKKSNKIDIKLINEVINIDPKIIVFIFSSRNINSSTLNIINKNEIGLILDSFTSQEIMFAINSNNKRIPHRIRKNLKTQKISNILSKRELEVGLMLLSGETITSISHKTNLSKQTISTYKKRMFEKFKVKNILEMSQIFYQTNN